MTELKRTRKPLKARVEKKQHTHIQVDVQKTRQLAQILSSSGWLPVNRGMMKKYGALCAIFMGQVLDSFEYYASRDKLQSDGSFFMKTDAIAENLGMSPHQVRRCKMEMKQAGVIRTIMKNVPPKEYYFLNAGILLESVYRINPKEIRGLTLKELEEYIKELKNKIPNKEKEDNPQPNKKITPDQFEEFWKLYPRKVGKPTAKQRWDTLSKKPSKDQPDFETIKKAIQEQSKSDQWQDPKYIPHPSTWINGERWEDELPAPSKPTPPKGSNLHRGTGGFKVNAKIERIEL
jgi:DNA-binding Lrp family transcriptional regulator